MTDMLQGDIARHRTVLNPAVWPLLVYRFGRAADSFPAPLRTLGSRVYGLARLAVEATSGTEIHRETTIGADLLLIHSGCIKIHPKAIIGDRVRINHDVTIGMQHDSDGVPQIGNDVLIGTGAKILGGVKVGDGAVICANSLVVSDIPAGTVAMGVPARPLPKRRSAAAPARRARHLAPVESARSSSEEVTESSEHEIDPTQARAAV